MAIRFVKVRSFSGRRRAREEAENEAAWREVKAHQSPLSEEYRRTHQPRAMLSDYAEKQRAAKKARKRRKVEIRGEKITLRS